MPIHPKLLEILRCPVTKNSLVHVTKQKLEEFNTQISEGTVRYSDGSVVKDPLDEALVTASGSLLYRIDSGIPVMLQDRSIPVTEFESK